MGWSSGNYLADDVWKGIKPLLTTEEQKKQISKVIYDCFCAMDADDWYFEEDGLYYDYLMYNNPVMFKNVLEGLDEDY